MTEQNYHPKWSLISRLVRRRAGDHCEHCNIEEGKIGYWNARAELITDCKAVEQYHRLRKKNYGHKTAINLIATEGTKLSKISLQVAHLDQDRGNNRFDNLAALCQRCYLKHKRARYVERKRNVRQTSIFI